MRIRVSQVKEEYDRQARFDSPNLVEKEVPVSSADIVNALAIYNQRIIDRQEATNMLLQRGFVSQDAPAKLVELYDN
jgi:hypothetical protein